ncbi:MAG: tripartite tricarboxylate transporter substrate binding protein [Deltaproteobacteria bacterium]|nr:tripartite tricarboxylate transporter substrate binding protein [Deltaproteobacteria bacterium]
MKQRKGPGRIVVLILLTLSLAVITSPGRAEYPERPVTLLVGFAPGGSLDLSARALAASAEKILGQPVIIENKTGGTGTVALASLLSQKPNGYTLCATPSSVLSRVSQIQRVPFRPLASFRPVIGYAAPQLGIAVRDDAPWKNLRDLIDEAGKAPAKIRYATTGVGSTTHAAVEEIAARAGVQMIHVPYKGSNEAMTALLGRHVEFASLTSEFVPAVRAGQLRLLATMGEERSPTFREVPTMKESGYDFVTDAVYGIVAPAGLPPGIAEKLEQAFTKAAEDRRYLETIRKMDLVPTRYDSKKFDLFLRTNWKTINRHLVGSGLIREAATRPE